MNPIPIIGLGTQSGFPSATAQRRLNCYLEMIQDPEKTSIVAYGMPGANLFADFGETPVRGVFQAGDYLYACHRGVLKRIDNAGTVVNVGSISTSTGRVDMDSNGTELILVDGTTTGYTLKYSDDTDVTISIASPGVVTWTGHPFDDEDAIQLTTTGSLPTGLSENTTYYVVNSAANTFQLEATVGGGAINTSGSQSGTHTARSVLSAITDTDYPGLTTVNFLDGYFVGHKAGTGKFYICSLYDGRVWDALDFATAESNPDDLVGTFVNQGYLYLFGEYTTEIWSNNGAQDFPFARIGNAAPWGLVSTFSVSKLGNTIAFLAKNQLGQNQVCVMEGAEPMPISDNDIDRILNDATDLTAATAFSFMTNGHQFYVITMDDKTYAFDLNTQVWSQLKGENITRYNGEMATSFVNAIVVADYNAGKLYRMSDSVYTFNGDEIAMEIVGKVISNNREYLTIDEVLVDMESGVGNQNGSYTDPQIMLSISKDQGHTFPIERWADLGAVGDYTNRAVWRRLGRGRDITLKLRITDPVKRCITGTYARFR